MIEGGRLHHHHVLVLLLLLLEHKLLLLVLLLLVLLILLLLLKQERRRRRNSSSGSWGRIGNHSPLQRLCLLLVRLRGWQLLQMPLSTLTAIRKRCIIALRGSPGGPTLTPSPRAIATVADPGGS